MEIKNITYSYPNSKVVLKDINIKIKDNSIIGIIGPNGSGKTTLLDIITGLVKPTSGEIKNNKKVGYLFQNTKSMFFKKTVYAELKASASIHNYRLNQLDKRIKDVLKIVKLDELVLEKKPLTLSNNEAKKVALASILMYNPKIIILDEPTSGLDNKTVEEFKKLFKMLKNRYKKTIIVVSHDMDFIHSLVDEVYVLNKGEIVLQGNKYDVFKNTRGLKKLGLLPPRIMLFSDTVLLKKGIKLGYREEINDLIKDIYRNV